VALQAWSSSSSARPWPSAASGCSPSDVAAEMLAENFPEKAEEMGEETLSRIGRSIAL
jgi:hypothetical protein